MAMVSSWALCTPLVPLLQIIASMVDSLVRAPPKSLPSTCWPVTYSPLASTTSMYLLR